MAPQASEVRFSIAEDVSFVANPMEADSEDEPIGSTTGRSPQYWSLDKPETSG